ncbi:MAG: quinol:electron acceptor oxidoreductase subunit ActD [Flavobacteriales bacterium]
MILVGLVVFLTLYVWAYIRCAQRGFRSARANALLVASGMLMLAPVGGLVVWYYMIHDWPVNIGGKPNMTWYQNEPAPADLFSAALYTGAVLLSLVLVSLLYAVFRMLTHRGRPTRG